MAQNVGGIDRILRIIVGAALLVWGFVISPEPVWWAAIGAVPLLTGLIVIGLLGLWLPHQCPLPGSGKRRQCHCGPFPGLGARINMRLRFLTAGESHGPVLTAVLEGMPAGLTLDLTAINQQMARRQKGVCLGQPFLTGSFTVPIGDFITEHMSDADPVKGLGDGRQGVFNRKRRGMVVDDEGHTVFGTVKGRCQGAGLDHLQIQAFVDMPPDVLEYLSEICRYLPWGRHASRQGGVDVMVTAAEGLGHQLAGTVDYPILRGHLIF